MTVRDSEIGWTNADNSGNTGYGIRVHGSSLGSSDRLKIVGNRIHHIAGDGIQGLGNGTDVLIDRNEIGYVGANPGSSEHSDNIQIIDNGPNLKITNNWLHHQGWYDATTSVGNAGATYIHGGDSDRMTYENNLIEHSRGRVEVCGLGTGGTSRSNITVRRNTVSRQRPDVWRLPRPRVGLWLGDRQSGGAQHRSGPRRRFRHRPYRIQVGVLGEQQPVRPAVARQPRRPRQLHVIEQQPRRPRGDRLPEAGRRALVAKAPFQRKRACDGRSAAPPEVAPGRQDELETERRRPAVDDGREQCRAAREDPGQQIAGDRRNEQQPAGAPNWQPPGGPHGRQCAISPARRCDRAVKVW